MNSKERLKEVSAACYEQKDHTGVKLVCEAGGREMIFTKPVGRRASKIKVDGCVIKNKTACDYLVYDWKGRYHFVELKGRDVEGAFAQLAASISYFFPSGAPKKFWCFIVCTKSPPNSLPSGQNAQARLKQKWIGSMTLKVKVNRHIHRLME